MGENQTTMRELVGFADGCELLSTLTRYPDRELAQALVDGSLAADALGCMNDAPTGANRDAILAAGADVDSAAEAFSVFGGLDPEKLCADLRMGYSLIHHRQFSGVEVFPYESAFLHCREGREGEPALFRSPVTLRVEQHMRQAGVLPRTSRTEPCDSLWDELSFLAYLWGKAASALWEKDSREAALWDNRARLFAAEHVLKWMGDYLDRSSAATAGLVENGDVQPVCSVFCKAVQSYGCVLLAAITQSKPLA